MQPIRTTAEISADFKICPSPLIPLYQKYAQKVAELRLLGISFQKIARSLGISARVTENAYCYYLSLHVQSNRENNNPQEN